MKRLHCTLAYKYNQWAQAVDARESEVTPRGADEGRGEGRGVHRGGWRLAGGWSRREVDPEQAAQQFVRSRGVTSCWEKSEGGAGRAGRR